MDHKSKVRQIALAALILIGGAEAGCAQALTDNSGNTAAPAADSQPTVTALAQVPTLQASAAAAADQTAALTPDEAKQSATGNVAELQQMINSPDLAELRKTSNGSYSASLLFYGKEMVYYITLSQQGTFWRVIKSTDEVRAEAIYRDFVRQTFQLSDIEIRRTRLEAQKAFTERMIALSQDHANRLQADLTIARQQQAVVADQQKQTRDEANSLQTQKAAAQNQLRSMQRQVRELQRQVESGLAVR
ncbi:DUF2968 domain-containing protein [Paraburkholderia caballeronis]|uniref:DUF2968 domain-containing protein n=1 Tax=Paraburkholderia caballeronis TaxID=416943 RepID=UPI00106486E1|nr:DUF2968 domain-containing protein [Paraburkholderia caballeronis]TDV11576.1 hypothetical protein C7406_12051 [Paraburkholderia caballeronis]TDV17417.1 hypothetical protein C7408_10471 [Paraburkholderia caballeronis]TDV27435.1 hypothetical protein C7404_10471 [Paraburkholderia caballeronis]